MTTFGIVGSGWRAEFFLRLAAMAPDRLRVSGVVTRREQRGAEVTARYGVPAFRTAHELVAAEPPEFVIVSVPWAATPDVTRELVAQGVRVLAETPPAPDLPGLRRLWEDVGASGLVQVAEQYLLMPGHAARLQVVRDGVIGEPTAVQVCSTHLYHAVSMIRGLLGVGFAPAVVHAREFTAPLADPLTPDGWTHDAAPQPRATTIATLDFDGRMGLYDFTENQWWNPLRGRRIVVRGTTGEISDDQVVRLADPTTPVTSPLCPSPHRHRPQPRGQRARPHQLRRPRRLPQSVPRRALLRGRPRRRAAARPHRRMGARRGPGAVPAGRRPAGSCAQRRDPGVRGERPRGARRPRALDCVSAGGRHQPNVKT